MAKTFYGYAERDAESYVDWSQIGSDISEMLNEEISRRTTLKADLDKASREYGETLANAPTGEHKGATDFITDLTSNAMQARLVQDRLLKSGQLKVKDYLLMRENLKSGTQQVFDVAKKFQEEYARKTERMTKNESAAYEQELFKLTEGFSNFNNSGAYINPTNYQVSLAKKERVEVGDGKHVYRMSKNPSEFFTVTELNNFASADVDRFDIAGAVSKIASEVGERINQTYSIDPGKKSFIIRAVSDASGDAYKKMLEEGDLTPADVDVVIKFQEQIKAEIGAITGNRLNALSVYTDAMVGFKDFTFNEDEQGDGMVLLDKDPAGGLPMPNFENEKGKELLIDIEKNILDRIKVRLDQSVTTTGTQIKEYSTGAITDETKRRNRASKDLQTYSVWIRELIEGDQEVKAQALTKFANRNPDNVDHIDFVVNPDGTSDVIAYMVDGTENTILRDWHNRTKREIADAFLFNKLVPTINDNTQQYYEDIIDATGIADYTKVEPYQFRQGSTDLYIDVDDKDRVKSKAKQYTLIPEEDMVVVRQGGVNAKPAIIWNERALSDDDPKGFQDLMNASYLGSLHNKNVKQNPFKAAVVKMTTIPASKMSEKGMNFAYGSEYNQTLMTIDPKYGQNFLVPAAKDEMERFQEVMTEIGQAAVNGAKFTREDLYKIMGEDSYFTKYNRGYFDDKPAKKGKSR